VCVQARSAACGGARVVCKTAVLKSLVLERVDIVGDPLPELQRGENAEAGCDRSLGGEPAEKANTSAAVVLAGDRDDGGTNAVNVQSFLRVR
jgi:hypothetical protein